MAPENGSEGRHDTRRAAMDLVVLGESLDLDQADEILRPTPARGKGEPFMTR
jgi:hypothetical protein